MKTPIERAGWSINEHIAAVGISRTTFYALPPEKRPRSVKLASKTVITESPEEYLARIGKEAAAG